MGLDSDEATGDLMVLRASHGHPTLLYWGGNYGGAGITWVEAVLVKIFGFHLALIWVVDTAVALGCSVALWSIARRLMTPIAAAVAGGVFLFFPPTWLFWSGREYVFYAPGILFALLCAKFVLDWFGSQRERDAVIAGLLFGIAIWTDPMVASLVVPPAIALAIGAMRRRATMLLVPVGAAALVGVSPWLAYFALHGRSAFAVQADSQSDLTAVRHSIGTVLPAALTASEKRVGLVWAVNSPSHSVLAAMGGAVMVLSLICLIGFVVARRWGLSCCAASILLWPWVLTAAHVPLGLATFRYGLIAVPPLLLVVAFLLSTIRLALVLAVVTASLSWTIASRDTHGLAADKACLPSLTSLASHLETHGYHHVWAAYWIAADLTVCARPGLSAAATSVSRDVVARKSAASASPSVYVGFVDNGLDQQIGAYIHDHPGLATRRVLDGFAVWIFSTRVEPDQMKLSSVV
jgi:hypothetical protein